jgi:hypothetical protein
MFGTIRGGAGRVSLVLAVMTATGVVLALPAGAGGANTGSQSCDGRSANVTLQNNGSSAGLHKGKHCDDGDTTTTSTTTSTTMPPAPVAGPTESSTSTSTSTSSTTSTPVGDLGSTTSTAASPSTTSTTGPQGSSTTLGDQGKPDPSTTTIEAFPAVAQLPFTGGSLFPAIFGGACLLGGALLALRHRRTIWTLRK